MSTAAEILPRKPRSRRPRTKPSPVLSPVAQTVQSYIDGVLTGTVPAGELVRLAVQRHVDDLIEGPSRGLRFDQQKAERAIEFFSYLKHSKGEWAGQEFRLEPWQMFTMWVLFGWMNASGLRRFRTAYEEVPRKNGKALCIDTIVATPDGWKRHGDLRPGDYVFGPDGFPKLVKAVTANYLGPCHQLTFSDGCQIIAHERHEWQTDRTWYTGRRRGSRHPLPLVETAQIARTVRCGSRGDLVHGIAVAHPLQLPVVDLPVPPYTLGAWLGDGHSASSRLTCADAAILDRIVSEAVAVKKCCGKMLYQLGGLGRGGSPQKKAKSLQAKLRAIGVLHNKHIPVNYLRASEVQRRALLCGIMDTDGHVTPRGQCEIVLSRKRLFDDVVQLLMTLGYKPTGKTDVAKLKGRVVWPRYRVQFWARMADGAVSVPRKARRLKNAPSMKPRSSTRMIADVKPVGEQLVNCIEVEGGFYLAGPSLIITHNSTKAAGVGLKLAFADGEAGAEVYSAATKHDQALIVHSEATRMVMATPELRAKIQVAKNNLCRPDTYQKYEPLGADEDTLDGLNVHGAIVDELHAHKTRGVFDLMETGTSARRQPMLFAITTAGSDQSAASVCWEQHLYAEQVLRKTITDDTYFAFIASMDKGDDWREERSWYKANPNLGVSKKLDYMRDQARKAERMPAKLNSFLRRDLNEWTQQLTRWIDMQLWDANAGPPIEDAALQGRRCFGGLDLSSVSDLTAWVLLFPDPVVPGRVTIVPRLWCPEARLTDDERNQYREQYQAWARDGWLLTTPGNAIDYATIKEQILLDAQQFRVEEVAVDRLFQGYQLSMELADEGLTVAASGMGFMGMAGPCKEFERRLLETQLHHGGHPVLKWMANNVAVREDPAGNLKPDKASSQGKIDGIIGILLALDRIMRHTSSPSVYETRGMLLLGGESDGETAHAEEGAHVRSESVTPEDETPG